MSTYKLLYTPYYGYPWSCAEENSEIRKFIVTYPPLILLVEALESERDFNEKLDIRENHPIFKEMQEIIRKKWGKKWYPTSCENLKVYESNSPLVKITEHDGKESIEELSFEENIINLDQINATNYDRQS
jgi:hypothetical protein